MKLAPVGFHSDATVWISWVTLETDVPVIAVHL